MQQVIAMSRNAGRPSGLTMRWAKWLIISAGTALLLAIPVFVIKYNAAEARGLIEVVSSLRIGQKLDLSDSRLNKYSAYRWNETSSCKGHSGATYQFINPWLNRLHLAPKNQVDVSVETEDGRLIQRIIGVYGEPRYGATLVQGESGVCGTGITGIAEHRKVTNVDYGPYFRKVRIEEDQTISESQLNADWKIDLSCVGSMHTCSRPDQVLRSGLAVGIQ